MQKSWNFRLPVKLNDLAKTIGEGTFGKVVLGTHKIVKENVK